MWGGAQLHSTIERLSCTDSKIWSSDNWDNNRCTFYKSYSYKTTEESFDLNNQLTSKLCKAQHRIEKNIFSVRRDLKLSSSLPAWLLQGWPKCRTLISTGVFLIHSTYTPFFQYALFPEQCRISTAMSWPGPVPPRDWGTWDCLLLTWGEFRLHQQI